MKILCPAFILHGKFKNSPKLALQLVYMVNIVNRDFSQEAFAGGGGGLAHLGLCVLQGVAGCCSVLLCVAVCCCVLQCVSMCCNVWQHVAVGLTVCCSVVQCGAVLRCGF